ncbi:hypothetical protein [Alloactinosynnema sp. L-07]|nr:hypothetical protein [Alloactinosynnema sp. L-07]
MRPAVPESQGQSLPGRRAPASGRRQKGDPCHTDPAARARTARMLQPRRASRSSAQLSMTILSCANSSRIAVK